MHGLSTVIWKILGQDLYDDAIILIKDKVRWSDHGVASRKGGDTMIALVELLDILKGIATILSIVLSVRKLYRWIRRKLNKRKPTV